MAILANPYADIVSINHSSRQRWQIAHGSVALTEVQSLAHGIIKVSHRLSTKALAHSYAVIADEVTETLAEGLEVMIDERSGLLSILRDGVAILTHEPSLGIRHQQGKTIVHFNAPHIHAHAIGLGEKTGPIDKRGKAFRFWNTDAFGYKEGSDPLYASIPFFSWIHTPELSYGLFVDCPSDLTIDLGASNERFFSFEALGDAITYYILTGHSPELILNQYHYLTGKAPLPNPKSLGLQQCRYSYFPSDKVLDIAKKYRQHDIPCDMIYLDIHYMDAFKVFTWDKKHFPAPETMLQQLKDWGFTTTVILDPGIKVEPGYTPYEEGKAKDLFLNYVDGLTYQGSVWPGVCHLPDFTKTETRLWWAAQVKALAESGVTGFWNDMNEPAVWGQSIPATIMADNQGEPTYFNEVRNVYGHLMSQATAEGAKAALDKPFVLTRAAFAGSQRHTAVWTGDNQADDAHMLLGCRLVANLGLSGIPFAGMDIGGFEGDPSPALMVRWLSIGAFQPLFRVHSMINSRDREPWALGENALSLIRDWVKLRYRFLPQWNHWFYQHHQTASPVLAPVAFHYPWAHASYDHRWINQFMVGDQLLVCPVESNQKIAEVWLPDAEKWYHLFSDKAYAAGEQLVKCGLNQLPVFVKAGSILALQQPKPYADATNTHPLELHVWPGELPERVLHPNGDDWSITISQDGLNRIVNVKVNEDFIVHGYPGLRLVLHGIFSRVVVMGDQLLDLEEQAFTWVHKVETYDPLGGHIPGSTVKVSILDLPNTTVPLVIQYH